MARAYPPDVIVLDTDGLLHARLKPGARTARLGSVTTRRLPESVFQTAVVTPAVADEKALTETLKRLRSEAGRIDKVSLLLPDPWFRTNLIELPPLSERHEEALHTVRWSLKRTLPIPPEALRMVWTVLGKTAKGVNLFVLSAVEATLTALEKAFDAAGMDVVLIEPVGLNIWNAVTLREANTSGDRLFFYIREHDFTTAVFRGAQPLFVRSRNLSGERTLQQEIRLSASYLRDTLRTGSIEHCYVAANAVDQNLHRDLEAEFSAPVTPVSVHDFVERVPPEARGVEAELTACTGVFTG